MIEKYTIPDRIKDLMTYDFLKEFRNQLFTVFDFDLETYADIFQGIESTNGWANALEDACHNTGKDDIWNYWNELEWYDSDMFDGELGEMLVENRLILPTLDVILKNYLNVEPEDIRVCAYCGRTFTKDMVITHTGVDAANDIAYEYICKHCNSHKEG